MPLALQAFLSTIRQHVGALGLALALRAAAIVQALSSDSREVGELLATDATEAFLSLGDTAAELTAAK